MTPASPCINLCRMDARTGYCEGCYRSIDEITVWSRASDERKRAILQEVAARRAAAGLFDGGPRGDRER